MSHHPPIGVGHGENDNWTYDIVSAPSTKFLGNSVEIYPIGAPSPFLYSKCVAGLAASFWWSLPLLLVAPEFLLCVVRLLVRCLKVSTDLSHKRSLPTLSAARSGHE